MIKGWGFHACIFDADCRRWDTPNRWHLFTPWGQLIAGIGRDNWIQAWLPRKGYRGWFAPVVWHPHPRRHPKGDPPGE